MANNTINRPRAFSYARWSTSIQGSGDSSRRQDQLAIEYAERNGLDLATEDFIRDEGVSGFAGQNLSQGALGAFIRAVETGKISEGSYLLVESFDRLSRQTVDEAIELFLNITRHGIILVTLADQQVYRKPVNMAQLIMSIVYMARANEESEMKRQRGRSNWIGKRQKANHIKLTSICPGWLTLNPDRQGFTVIEERAETVRQIFDRSLSGQGAFVIARALNREGLKTFGGASAWGTSSVKKILNNRSVIGEYQPHRKPRDSKQRIAEGEPIQNYFPMIIKPDEFRANQAVLYGRRNKMGRRGYKYRNLFTGLAHCNACGAKMHLLNKGMSNKSSGSFLYCHGAIKGICRESHGWPYEHFEVSFLSFVNEIELKAIVSDGSLGRLDLINGELHQLEDDRRLINAKRDRLLEAYENASFGLDELNKRMSSHERNLLEIETRRYELDQERDSILNSRRASEDINFVGFPENINDVELYNLRAKAAEQIRAVVERIDMVKQPLATVAGRMDSKFTVYFKGGASRVVFPDSANGKDAFIVANVGFPAEDKAKLPISTIPISVLE